MSSPWRPQRLLRLQRPNHRIVFQHIDSAIQSAEPRLMRQQLRKRDFFFTSLRKLRPEVRDPLVERDFVFLQCMQDTCAANSLRRRPHQNECVACPRIFAARFAKSAVKVDDRFSILPNRHRSAQFAKLFEILLE